MLDVLTTYFDGEKNGGLFLAGLGILAIVAATILVRPRFGLRSFAVTLIVLALIEIAIGAGLYLRTDAQVGRLASQLQSDPARFYAGEGARMDRVQRSFIIIQYVEIAVIAICAIMAFAFKRRPVTMGVALGLLIHAALLLAFDLIAERRGAVYLDAIRRADLDAGVL